MLNALPNLHHLPNESRRLMHGRGGFFEGWEHVAIDWFTPVILVTFYAEKENNRALVTNLIAAAQELSLIHI